MANVQKSKSEVDVTGIRIVLMCTIPVTASSFCLPLARELRKKGHEVIFCFADGAEAEAISSEGFQVEIISIRRKPLSFSNLVAVMKLAVFLKRNDVKVIETTTPVASIVGRLSAVLAGVPARINTVRGMFPRKTHQWQSLLFDWTEKILHRLSSYTITINEGDKQELLTKGFAKQGRIATIGCGGVGLDLKEFDPSRHDRISLKETRETFGIKENDFVVTFIGRLTEEKGIIDYVEIISELLVANNDIKGLVVGDALEDEHEAVSRVKLGLVLHEKGINKKVTLTGHRDDVPALMAISDVVVLPSKREGFGMVLAEAAAMEKPVVAYRCRGVAEVVIHGKTGFIVEPGDIKCFTEAIQWLHNNRKNATGIGKAARTEAETRFGQKEVLKQYIEIYEEVILGVSS